MSDRALRVVSAACAWGVCALTAGLIGHVAWTGAGALSWDLLITAPTDAGRSGGLSSVIVATAGVLGVGLLAAVPLGLAVAVWLAEFPGRGAGVVRGALDVLASVPSIVHGLFGMAVFCELLGMGWSLLAGGLTAGVMVLPLFARLAEESLRAVPDGWRMAGAAAGLDRWQLLGPVLLPAALPGLIAALVLSVGRVLAESAALLFTAGTALRMPAGLDDPGRVLALHVYTLAVDVPGGQDRAAAAALVLFALTAATTGLARLAPGWVARRVRRC